MATIAVTMYRPFSLTPFTVLLGMAAAWSAPTAAAQQAAAEFATLDDLLDEFVDTGAAVGVYARLERGGDLLWEGAAGTRDRDAGASPPMTGDTIVRMYSMTKPVTCVAALLLCESGKLALDDPVAKHVPALAGLEVGVEEQNEAGERVLRRVPAERPMTIRDLMRHTSGLTYGLFARSAVDTLVERADLLDPNSSLPAMVDKLAELPLKHQPGTIWEYGISTDLLGRVVEVASGMTLADFLAQRIFAPLGMTDSAFFVPSDKADRSAALYERADGALVRSRLPLATEQPGLLSGGGGLYSTADDYLRFCRMLGADGELDGVRLLQPESVAQMRRNQLNGIPLTGMVSAAVPGGFGLGVSVVAPEHARPGLSAGTYGWGGAAGTLFWIDPNSDVIAIFVIQNLWDTALGTRFRSAAAEVLAAR